MQHCIAQHTTCRTLYNSVEYSVMYSVYRDLYNKLCEKYELAKYFDFNGNHKQETDYEINEDGFIKQIEKAKSAQHIEKLYTELNDHKKEITLSKRESWELLLNKTKRSAYHCKEIKIQNSTR